MLFFYKSARDYMKTSWYVLAFALAGLVFTLAPHKWELGIAQSPDYRVATWINQFVGTSPAYDSLLRFLNSDGAQALGAIVILAIFVAFAWRERFYDVGRFFGYLLWIGAGIVLALLLAYYVTERIEEEFDVRGPAYHLSGFRNINDFHSDWSVRVKDKSSVPSRFATVYFSIFWLVWFRSRRLALALLIPAVLLSPAYMLIGREWPSALIAGILWAGAVGTLFTRTPLAVIPRWIEDNSAYVVERLLTFWTTARSRKTTFERPIERTVEIPEGPRVVIRNAPATRRDHLSDLIQRHILPILSCEPGSEVVISGLSPDNLQGEPSRTMRFVTGGGLPRGIVVKAAWKNPFNATQARRFAERRNAANMHALLQLRDVPVAQLLFTQNTRRIFAPRRFFFTVEELISDRILTVGDPADCASTARELSRLHNIERAEAGGLFGMQIPRERYPHRATLPRVREAYGTIIREMPGAELAFFGKHALNWFWEKSADLIGQTGEFSLCHGNLRPHFVRMTATGPVFMGFNRTSFNLTGFDVVQAMTLWGGGKIEAMQAVAEGYFAESPPQRWAQFQTGFAFFTAMILFEMLHDSLMQPEAVRHAERLRHWAREAAEVLRGNLPHPSSPKEAAEILSKIYGPSE